ncbi:MULTISPECIES: hypothetical protein [unclassified Pseudomonas]|uniref:hypothetical protein n=1 Tax=unclassified Pseudomonas TaxID=196821 RepID=UPI00111C4374|nr:MULTISPECIES: hypothetical protein [unclassified Pseudomonas]
MPSQLIQTPSPYPYHYTRHTHLPCNLRRVRHAQRRQAQGVIGFGVKPGFELLIIVEFGEFVDQLTCVIIDKAVGLVSGHKDFDDKKGD